MIAKAFGFGLGMAVAMLALPFAAHDARTAPVPRDQVYRSASLDSHRTVTVAVLPVVSLNEDLVAERAVEAAWLAYYGGSRMRWVPADEVRRCMQESTLEPENLTRAVDQAIWRDGEVGPELAGRLAARLGVHAVLSIRIDRCELADGGRGEVAMRATLTDADGSRLWSICGCAAHGVPPTSAEQNFNADLTTIRPPGLDWQERGHNLATAMRTLMARWAWALPDPLYGSEEPDPVRPATPLLAGNAVR
jgi:hypothetical protein